MNQLNFHTNIAIPKRHKVGVIIGKFMPMHKGHEFLIRFGLSQVEQLYVLVDNTPNDTIAVAERAKILQANFPSVRVGYFPVKMPQEPSETPIFWSIWANGIQTQVNECAYKKALEMNQRLVEEFGLPDNRNLIEKKDIHIDCLIAAMDYGKMLSQHLKCDFIPLDMSRTTLNISATEIRNDTINNFPYVADIYKSCFTQKFAFIGAESTGKTTVINRIVETLADKQYLTHMIPEYAYQLLKTKDGIFQVSDVEKIIFAQEAQMQIGARTAGPVLLCDSDALTTKVYAQYAFPEQFAHFPQVLDNFVNNQSFTLTFVFKPDEHTGFVPDIHRKTFENNPDSRLIIFNNMVTELERLNRPYVIIDGSYEERFKQVFKILNHYYR